MANQSRIEFILTAVDKGLTAGFNRAIGAVKTLGSQARQSVNSITGLTGGVTGLVASLGGVISAAAGMQKLVGVSREFDRISAGLITATGSAEASEQAFGALQDFATKTPYDLAQVSDAFVKLVNFGLDPSERAMASYGNTSSALGKDLTQMIEAVADATTGEFERLKEFGIKARSEGDKVSFSFRGVTTTVGKNAKEIEQYLIELGETNFGDAMLNRMKTLDGALSNLGDEWDKVFLNISEAGIGDVIADGMRKGIGALEELNAQIVSGQLEANLRANLGLWSGWKDDIGKGIDYVIGRFADMEGSGKDGVTALTDAFREFPVNVRTFVGIMTVQVAAGFDKAMAYGRAFKAQFKAVFSDANDRTTYMQRVERELSGIDAARDASIGGLLRERDESIAAYKQKRDAAAAFRKDLEDLEKADATSGKSDRLTGFRVSGDDDGGTTAATKKVAGETKKLYQEQKRIATERLRAASQENILALEREKIAATQLPTELARAEAMLAIDRRMMAERVELKRQELAAIKADREASQADIIRAESDLAELLVQNEIQLNDQLRNISATRMGDVERSWRRGIAAAEEYQAAVRAALAAGAIDEDDARDRLVASGDDMGAAFSLGLQRARERMQTDAEMMIAIGDQVADQLANSLGMAFDSFIMGSKSAKDAFADMARSTISWLAQMILKQILYNALQKVMGGIGGFAGGGSVGTPTVALAGGGSVPGYSPHPKADNILAWLTAKEFVEPVDVVDHYGADLFEAYRRKLIPRNLARALMGGTLPSSSIPRANRLAGGGMPAPGSVPTVKAGDTKLRVINVLDKNLVSDYIRTADGETALLNMIRRNGTAIKTILG